MDTLDGLVKALTEQQGWAKVTTPSLMSIDGYIGKTFQRTAPADIVISDKSVSREHCIIGLANDELLVTDLNSTNGTYIDEVRIHRATILPSGSVLRVGQVSLRHTVQANSDADGRGGPRGLQSGRLAAAS